MPEQEIRSNIPPDCAGAIPLAEIRTTHFPTACALLAHGEMMAACCLIGRMAEFVFHTTAKALRIVGGTRNPNEDVAVPLKRFMECYDVMRDAQRKRRQWPVGIRLFAPDQR